jgi:hypothetical protein
MGGRQADAGEEPMKERDAAVKYLSLNRLVAAKLTHG